MEFPYACRLSFDDGRVLDTEIHGVIRRDSHDLFVISGNNGSREFVSVDRLTTYTDEEATWVVGGSRIGQSMVMDYDAWMAALAEYLQKFPLNSPTTQGPPTAYLGEELMIMDAQPKPPEPSVPSSAAQALQQTVETGPRPRGSRSKDHLDGRTRAARLLKQQVVTG